MGFEKSQRVVELNARLEAFMQEHVYPREHDYEDFTMDPNNLWELPDWFDDWFLISTDFERLSCITAIAEAG